MNRIKKFISFILSLTMMISIVTTVSASEIESPVTPTIGIGDMETGNFTEIDQLGEATYYVQKTDDYTVAIGIYNTFVDCSVYYHDTNSLSTAVVPVEKISEIFPKTRQDGMRLKDIKSFFSHISCLLYLNFILFCGGCKHMNQALERQCFAR